VASFPYFNGTGSVYVRSLSVNRRNNDMEMVPLKYGKLATKYPHRYLLRVYIGEHKNRLLPDHDNFDIRRAVLISGSRAFHDWPADNT